MKKEPNSTNKKQGKGCLVAIAIFFTVIILLVIAGIIFLNKNIKNYDAMDYSGLNLTTVADGTYKGSEDGGMVQATVEVTVSNHRITHVNILEHKCGKGKPAEAITDDIKKTNSLNVDAVSGATLSSNVIKTAVYNALTQ